MPRPERTTVKGSPLPKYAPSKDKSGDPNNIEKIQLERQYRENSGIPGERTQKRIAKFCKEIEGGARIKEACAKTGIVPKTYEAWRQRYRDYFMPLYERAKYNHRVLQGEKDGTDPVERPTTPFGAEWRERYFGHTYDTKPVTVPFQQRVIDAINNTKPGEATLILLPPDHSKTTILEEYATHQAADDPNVRIMFISKTGLVAQKRLGRIQVFMTDDLLGKKLIEDYGPFRQEGRDGRTWTQKYMKVARATSGERDFTIEAIGIGGQVYGNRTDLMILDDIADLDNQQNPDSVRTQKDWIRVIVTTRLGQKGRIVAIGTRMPSPEGDLYKQLMDDGFFDHVLQIPAEEEHEDGTVTYLWPQRFTPSYYQKVRKRLGTLLYSLVYCQKEDENTGRIFPRKIIEACYRKDLPAQRVPPNNLVVTGIDPATAGWTVGFAYGLNMESEVRTPIDLWAEKDLIGSGGDRMDGLIEFIVGLNATYGSIACALEANATFALLSTSLDLRKALAEINVQLIVVTSAGVGGNVGSANLEIDDLIIRTDLPPLFFNQLIQIPTMGGHQQMWEEWVSQMVRYETGNKKLLKDRLKAFQFAEYAVRWMLEVGNQTPTETEMEGMPEYLREQQERMTAAI